MGFFFEQQKSRETCGPLWYALQVRSRKETSVATYLQALGFEYFLPTYKSQRKWSDRLKEVEQPLFPGYLFSRFDFQNRRALVMAPGVLHIVGNGTVPIPVETEQIQRIQLAVNSDALRQPWPYVAVGERVRVTHGSLCGLEGILINFKGGHRVVLSVSLLQRSVAVEVDIAWVTSLGSDKSHAIAKHFAERLANVPVTSNG